jgi:hypothetical protein
MPRVRITSQAQGLFVGPAPSSGFHFVDSHGSPTGDVNSFLISGSEHNLIKQINGVQQIDYSIIIDRTNVSELGRRELVHRPIIKNPTVDLNFEYLTSDIKNEIRLGFNPNFYTGHLIGQRDPFYPDNTSVFLFSGFESRNTTPAYSGFHVGDDEADHSPWPFQDRDKRNIYLAVAPEGSDAKDMSEGDYSKLNVISFGNCYMRSWGTSFQVGSPIRNKANYICDNMSYHLSGSGVVPAVTSSGFEPIDSGNVFIAPKLKGEVSGVHHRGTASHIALTSDITFSMTSIGYGSSASDIKDVGIDFSDIKAQSVDFSVAFNRMEYIGMGHKIPIDRPIKYPIMVTTNINALVGANQEGAFQNLLEKDHAYDLVIEARVPTIYCSGFSQTEVAARYDVLKAVLTDISYSNAINESKFVNLSFNTDVADGLTGRGLFLSGKVFETGTPFSGFNF